MELHIASDAFKDSCKVVILSASTVSGTNKWFNFGDFKKQKEYEFWVQSVNMTNRPICMKQKWHM